MATSARRRIWLSERRHPVGVGGRGLAESGYTPKLVSIGDDLWLDSNGNGMQGKGEKPVPGATFMLLDSDGNVVAATNTDKNGY